MTQTWAAIQNEWRETLRPTAEYALYSNLENGVTAPYLISKHLVPSTRIQPTMGHLAFIRKFLYKIQPNQFHTVLLYNRGTEPHTILCGHPGRPGGGLSGLSGGL